MRKQKFRRNKKLESKNRIQRLTEEKLIEELKQLKKPTFKRTNFWLLLLTFLTSLDSHFTDSRERSLEFSLENLRLEKDQLATQVQKYSVNYEDIVAKKTPNKEKNQSDKHIYLSQSKPQFQNDKIIFSTEPGINTLNATELSSLPYLVASEQKANAILLKDIAGRTDVLSTNLTISGYSLFNNPELDNTLITNSIPNYFENVSRQGNLILNGAKDLSDNTSSDYFTLDQFKKANQIIGYNSINESSNWIENSGFLISPKDTLKPFFFRTN